MNQDTAFMKYRRANYNLYNLFRCTNKKGVIEFVLPKEQPHKGYMAIYSEAIENMEFETKVESDYYEMVEDIQLECYTFLDLLEHRKLTQQDLVEIEEIQHIKRAVNLRDYYCPKDELLNTLLRF